MKKLYFLLLTVLMTATSFGQVFITEIADPNNNAEARFIELYNAGPTDVDFTEGNGWQIDKYTNASASVSVVKNLISFTLSVKIFVLTGMCRDF